MESYVRNICTKNYQNLIISFKVTVENVRDVFLRHGVLFVNSRNLPCLLENHNFCAAYFFDPRRRLRHSCDLAVHIAHLAFIHSITIRTY